MLLDQRCQRCLHEMVRQPSGDLDLLWGGVDATSYFGPNLDAGMVDGVAGSPGRECAPGCWLVLHQRQSQREQLRRAREARGVLGLKLEGLGDSISVGAKERKSLILSNWLPAQYPSAFRAKGDSQAGRRATGQGKARDGTSWRRRPNSSTRPLSEKFATGGVPSPQKAK